MLRTMAAERTCSKKEAIDIIKKCDAQGNKVPFSIEFCTLNQNRKIPSKHMRIDNAIEAGARHSLVQHRQIGVKPLDGSRSQIAVNICLIKSINGMMVL